MSVSTKRSATIPLVSVWRDCTWSNTECGGQRWLRIRDLGRKVGVERAAHDFGHRQALGISERVD